MMLSCALKIAAKDLRLVLARGSGLVQALLLGLILIFLFSLSNRPGELIPPQGAAAIFWLASIFCQVLIFNTLHGLEDVNGARLGLIVSPAPPHSVWLGKGLAGLLLLLTAQAVFIPAAVVFLGQNPAVEWGGWLSWLGAMAAVDLGLAAMGSLLGALALGQAAKESLLSVVLFPLLIPILLAGVRLGGGFFSGGQVEAAQSWFGVVLAFDALFLGAGLLLFPFVYSLDD